MEKLDYRIGDQVELVRNGNNLPVSFNTKVVVVGFVKDGVLSEQESEFVSVIALSNPLEKPQITVHHSMLLKRKDG